MILVLGARRQVRTLRERQVPRALKIKALERVWTIHSCLNGTPIDHAGIFTAQKEQILSENH